MSPVHRVMLAVFGRLYADRPYGIFDSDLSASSLSDMKFNTVEGEGH